MRLAESRSGEAAEDKSSPQRPLLRVEDLSVEYQGRKALFSRRPLQTVKAVRSISFDIFPGETLALVGESGSGKSSTGKALLQLIVPTSGSVQFRDVELTSLAPAEMRRMRRELQMVFQDPYGSLNPRMTVKDIVGEPLIVHGVSTRDEAEARVLDLLETVGLDSGLSGRYPSEFSGGQRQRIGIARALALEPALVVADEPTSALDVSVQAQIVNLMRSLQGKFGLTYLYISHDLSVVRIMADRVAVMYAGEIVEIGVADRLYRSAGHPYTRALLASIPSPDPRRELARIKSSMRERRASEELGPPETGCRFAPRCPRAEDICIRVRPELMRVADGQRAACHFASEVAAVSLGYGGGQGERELNSHQNIPPC